MRVSDHRNIPKFTSSVRPHPALLLPAVACRPASTEAAAAPDSPARKAEDLVEIAILVRKACGFTTGMFQPLTLQEIAPHRAGSEWRLIQRIPPSPSFLFNGSAE
jgi:hypothetical protein